MEFDLYKNRIHIMYRSIYMLIRFIKEHMLIRFIPGINTYNKETSEIGVVNVGGVETRGN